MCDGLFSRVEQIVKEDSMSTAPLNCQEDSSSVRGLGLMVTSAKPHTRTLTVRQECERLYPA